MLTGYSTNLGSFTLEYQSKVGIKLRQHYVSQFGVTMKMWNGLNRAYLGHKMFSVSLEPFASHDGRMRIIIYESIPRTANGLNNSLENNRASVTK